MATDNKDSRYHALSLRQIAGWEIPSVDNSNSEIRAKVPSLQRGLVWEPQQIELLWDSLMQGFPIGSLVLSAKNSEQKDKSSNFSAIANQKPVTHHILDGQQRCYAIALGFHDLWHDNDQAILWLDLKPGNRLQNSIRQYLFRVTTKSHPWGFGHDNQSSRLSAGNIRESLGAHTERPLPKELRPFDAGLPVPVFLLFKHFNMGTEKLNWDAFSEDLAELIPNSAGITYDDSIDRENIEGGLSLAEKAIIIALQVPAKVKKIENIEQIFQRLNRQGTPLDNEELTYSMIKAYWPDVEECLESLDSLRHTTEPRLINMAIRVALTGQDGKMHTELTVDRIRNIFRPSDSKVRKKEDIDDANKAIAIKEYFQDKLKLALQWIDDHFLFHEKNRPYGLPAYLRSSLAWNSRDVFAWLMVVAKRHDYKPVTNEQLLKKIIGLALSIHWFGSDKTKAVEKLLLEKDLGSENVKLSNLKNDKGESLIFSPIDKVELEEILSLSKDSTKKSLSDWKSFWHAIVEADDQNQPRKEKDKEDRSKKYGQFMERLRNNRELLVYVQRSYFASKFRDFDPSNRLMWKGHNRPWDYDHILPSNKLNASGRGGNAGDFHDVCKVWQQSIGNLIAVDFTFNRGEQDNTSSKKYNSERASELNGVLDCIDAYDIELEDTANFEKSIAFVVAARNRLIELYRRWYDSLDVGNYK
ncbi:MAG: hypothetical protein A4S08_10085 [Proteobacteria bacterium SG_bin4]|nr:MAG: hypothetical protein A4S08_10085 [Proteobacteria bacterium SG_bin4]